MNDFNSYPVAHTISSCSTDGKKVQVKWSDGHLSKFYFLWLRDNCPCCCQPDTSEPMFNIASVSNDLFASSVNVTEDGFLKIIWSGESHTSEFHPGWLRYYCHLDPSIHSFPAATTWDSINKKEPERFQWETVTSDPEIEMNWLCSLVDAGCSITQNIDPTKDGLIEVTKRIGIVRETTFGLFFDVKAKTGPDTAAYTNIKLLPQTDLPTREYQPGLQLLHCLKNSVEGGENILVDGFRVAEEMKLQKPEMFDLLSTVPWDFSNRSRVTDYRWKAPIIKINSNGSVEELRVGNFLHAPLQVDFEIMEPMYDAYKFFETLSQDDFFKIKFHLAPGECLIFDNRRLLHARDSFDLSKGERHLCGCYIERDELWSSIRMLERKRKQNLINSRHNK